MKTVAMRKAAKAKANGDGKKKKRVTRTKKVLTQGERFNPKDAKDVRRRTTKTKTTPRKKVVKERVDTRAGRGKDVYGGTGKSKTVTRKRKDGSTVTREKRLGSYGNTLKTKSKTVRGKDGKIISQKTKAVHKRKRGDKIDAVDFSRKGFKNYISPDEMKKRKTKIAAATKKGRAKATITKGKRKTTVKSTYKKQ